jgi:ATP-dependent protease ClpP protease subunit
MIKDAVNMAWGRNDETKPKVATDRRPPGSMIRSFGGSVYFYSPVDTMSILDLTEKVTAMCNQIPPQFYGTGYIKVHINSHGGYVTDGLCGMDMLKTCPVPICTIVDGVCASAATFLSVTAPTRLIRESSYMLIHQLSSACWGTFSQLQDDIKNSELMMETIRKIYLKNTKIKKDKLDQILKKDLYFDAKTCLKLGLVDGILKLE